MPIDITDYRDIFLNDRPMMDTRAPVEFVKGAFPGVVNLPLMNDDERQRVGTCYKQQGQQAAIVLGHQLVSGATLQERLARWTAFAQANPEGYLYCFRGGLRSHLVQKVLKDEVGSTIPGSAVATRLCVPSCWRPRARAVRFRPCWWPDRQRQDRSAPATAQWPRPGRLRQPPGLQLWQAGHGPAIEYRL